MSVSVSVAVCTFNGENYVEDQLSSILSQSVLPDEIVIADDGSADATLRIVNEFVASHSTSGVAFRILEKSDRLGVTKNFERAVTSAGGDLIVLCDQDDVWHADRLEIALRSYTASPGLSLQAANADLVDENGAATGITLFEALAIGETDIRQINQGEAFFKLLRRNLVTGATVVIGRKLLASALPFPPEWVHDEWLAIIASSIGRIEMIDIPLIDYRQHSANQIGVRAPSLAYRIGRLLAPREDRYAVLLRRSSILVERLVTLSAPAPFIEAASEKARFEAIRARYPRRRLSRIRMVLREYRRGSYSQLSSQGNLDVVRDLLHRA